MIYHIVVGDMAAAPLKEAINLEESMEGNVLALKDLLHIGPLQKGTHDFFSQARTAYWNEVILNEKDKPVKVDDLERLMEVSTALSNNEEATVWIWMAPWPADVCAYYWALTHLKKHLGRIYLLNIAGLPFLNEEGKVYYPKNLSEIAPKELVKARKLAREVTPAELEVDGEEWENIVAANTGVRVLEGGKKISSKEETHYDKSLISFCSQQYQKASKIVRQALSKLNIPTADTHLGWRLSQLAEQGILDIQGPTNKTLTDFSVKLAGGEEIPAEEETTTDSEETA
ncbi:MAG: DUF3658 domain-containing protein [Flavipsychrobacter sp.]